MRRVRSAWLDLLRRLWEAVLVDGRAGCGLKGNGPDCSAQGGAVGAAEAAAVRLVPGRGQDM